MAAVVVPDTHRQGLSDAIAGLKSTIGIPLKSPLHWNQHAKTFGRRRLVSETLARVEGVRVNYVIFAKASIPSQAAIMSDRVLFYNFVAGIALERVLLTASEWPGPDKRIQVHFGHVKGFDHNVTQEHFASMRRKPNSIVDWSLLVGDPGFKHTDRSSGIQAADQYAGILKQAICADEFGQYEEHHLLSIAHQIRKNPATGRAWGYGFKVMAPEGAIEGLPWWRGG